MTTGSFTVLDITTSPTGRVETLDATFEHHCEGGRSAARGEVHVVAGPEQPPIPLMTLDAPTVAATGTADGRYGLARVHGTVTCSKPTEVLVEGLLTQTVRREQVVGSFFAQVWCEPGAPVAWTGTALGGTASGSKVEFQRGDATVAVRASGYDGDHGVLVASSPVTAQVTLLRAR